MLEGLAIISSSDKNKTEKIVLMSKNKIRKIIENPIEIYQIKSSFEFKNLDDFYQNIVSNK